MIMKFPFFRFQLFFFFFDERRGFIFAFHSEFTVPISLVAAANETNEAII